MTIELPICRYRGDLQDGQYSCASPFLLVLGDGVPPETCRQCRYADRVPTAEEEAILPPVRGVKVTSLPCRHRGDPTGATVECPTCAGNVRIKLMVCAVHGTCTLAKKVDGVACCVGCPDYQATASVPGPG
jgi:hypothetical protein